MAVTINIDAIQMRRMAKGYSQKELAKQAGISPLAVNYLERKKTIPHPATLKKICNALDITVESICLIKN